MATDKEVEGGNLDTGMKLLKDINGLGRNKNRIGGNEDNVERGMWGSWDSGILSTPGAVVPLPWYILCDTSLSKFLQYCGTSDGLRATNGPCTLVEGESLKLEESVIKSWKGGRL